MTLLLNSLLTFNFRFKVPKMPEEFLGYVSTCLVKPIMSVFSRPLLHESTRENLLGSRVVIKIFAKAAVVRFFPRGTVRNLEELPNMAII